MEHLIRGVRDAIDKKSWYAAVALALALPDACAAVDQPNTRGKQRYRSWTDRYVTKYFCDPAGQPYLDGRELYLFRCAYLHAGELVLEDPAPTESDDARAMFEVLNRVNLYVSDVSVLAARGMTKASGGTSSTRATSYNVGVDDFCDAICRGAEDWVADARADSRMRDRLDAAPRIIRIGTDGSQLEV